MDTSSMKISSEDRSESDHDDSSLLSRRESRRREEKEKEEITQPQSLGGIGGRNERGAERVPDQL